MPSHESHHNCARLGASVLTVGDRADLRVLRAVRAARPDVAFVLENVYGMPGADRDVITAELGVTPVRLRADDVSPCRRDRYFWSNLPPRGLRPARDCEPWWAVLDSGQPVDRAADGKAGCIVRTAQLAQGESVILHYHRLSSTVTPYKGFAQ